MLENRSVLAIVPARSGSRGIPDKNMARLGGLSLIARTGTVLSRIPWIDRRIISTDSRRYAEEGEKFGLAAPFLRPKELSTDEAGAFEAILHALRSCERADNCIYELIVVAEPTSPLRETSDVEATARALLDTGADTALTVSRIDTKNHPDKAFKMNDGRLRFYTSSGKRIVARQQLETLYSRNGLCYCIRRETLVVKGSILTGNMAPVVTDRPVANIDEPVDLLWAEFLIGHHAKSLDGVEP